MDKTATFTQNNGDTTLKIEFTVESEKMLKLATAWAKYDWNHGYGDHGTEEVPIVFDDLTNQEKIDLILDRVFALGKDEAMTQIHTDATPDATAESDKAEINNL